MRILNFVIGGASLASSVYVFAIAAHATGLYAASMATIGAIGTISGAMLLYKAVK